jgi:restriction system protein
MKSTAKSDWTRAQGQLDGRYSWDNARENAVIAKKRIEYLKVSEPTPELHEFLPKGTLTKFLLADAENTLASVKERHKSDLPRHRLREEERKKELQEAEELLEQLLAQERRNRLDMQAEVWPTNVTLDSEIAAIEGIAAQVAAQNEKIAGEARKLGTILDSGLDNVWSWPADKLIGSRPLREDPLARRVENAVTGAAIRSIPPWLEFERRVKVAYSEDSEQAVIEFDFPDVQIIPTLKCYKYLRDRNIIAEVDLPASQVKSSYAEVIAQLTLLVVAAAFRIDRERAVETVVFNGYVITIDRRSGQMVRPCLVTVRATRDNFTKIHLRQVDPQACLKHLSASISASPTELAPVRPILEFSMVDPRFVTATDAISAMENRPNLLDLTPMQFEALIQNLFEKMGLEARQTQASRDGGVDCIAYDNRPIFGGKVVIQAKRYKNTVGVSAVRDLYGTLQNEGASKGILVTTSGYGPASFEFASNKPIELLDGPHLLYLLKAHANLDARIEAPADWSDPEPDSGHF